MGNISRILRFLARRREASLSRLRLLWLKAQYPGLVTRGLVTLGRDCVISVESGGSLLLENTVLGPRVHLKVTSNAQMTILDTFIGTGSVLVACASISIGAGSKIAEYVVVRDQDHVYGNGQPLIKSGFEVAPIKIGRNVWLGAKSTVLKGVSIPDNSVVAAHAVVSKTPAGASLLAGVPARVLRALHQ